MKLRKLALNAIALEHSEMKSIKAGYYGEYSCYFSYELIDGDDIGVTFWCGTNHGNSCMDDSGRIGFCNFVGGGDRKGCLCDTW